MLPANIPNISDYTKYEDFAYRVPVLSYEQEKEYFSDMTEENAMKIIVAFLRVPISIVRKEFYWSDIPKEELVQEGTISLIKAVRDFDMSFGTRFYSYVSHHVRYAISEYVTKNNKLIKYATTKARRLVAFNYNKLKSPETTFLSENEAKSIAEKLDVSVWDVQDYNQYGAIAYHSLGSPFPNSELYPEDLLSYSYIEEQPSVFETIAEPYRKVLNEREREIIRKRWIVDPECQSTLDQLSSDYGVSIARIQQIEKAAFGKIKKWVIEHGNG